LFIQIKDISYLSIRYAANTALTIRSLINTSILTINNFHQHLHLLIVHIRYVNHSIVSRIGQRWSLCLFGIFIGLHIILTCLHILIILVETLPLSSLYRSNATFPAFTGLNLFVLA